MYWTLYLLKFNVCCSIAIPKSTYVETYAEHACFLSLIEFLSIVGRDGCPPIKSYIRWVGQYLHFSLTELFHVYTSLMNRFHFTHYTLNPGVFQNVQFMLQFLQYNPQFISVSVSLALFLYFNGHISCKKTNRDSLERDCFLRDGELNFDLCRLLLQDV
jgi:hypothetical protein